MTDAPKKPIDLVWIQRATGRAKARCEWFEQVHVSMRADPKKDDRLDLQECVVCWYSTRPRQHCNRFTVRPCGVCGSPINWGNDDVPIVCSRCATTWRLCRHCGGTIDLRERRKFESEEPSR